MKRPRWFDDAEADLARRILGRFINSLDQGRKPQALRIDEKSAPELYRFHDQEAVNIRWELLTALDTEYGIVAIQTQPARAGEVIYEQARIRFNAELEDLVRQWLNRPRVDAYRQSWDAALAQMEAMFEDGGKALANNPIPFEVGAERMLQAFAAVGKELEQPMTLRSLSARCFWGDSKFLDHRESLIRALYPNRSCTLLERPILMNVSLPDTLQQIIFVENQDSFLALSQLKLEGQAVVYSAGFRGSAQRIRETGNVTFSYLQQSTPAVRASFEGWWFADQSQLPCYFWGDLDFSGMAILKTLRNTFPSMKAWRVGYQPLLDQLAADNGHSAEMANKKQQVDPVTTGCAFADEVLLPQMRARGFVDQEAVLPAQLEMISSQAGISPFP